MSAINPVTSNAALVVTNLINLYTCPASGKSHAVVDIGLFKPNTSSATFSVYVTSTAIGSLANLDAINRNSDITTTNGSFLLEKTIVGPGESVYIKSHVGAFNARLSGVEENVATIHNAGRLAAVNIGAGVLTPVAIIKPATVYVGAVLGLGSISIHNNNLVDSVVDLYISTGGSPVASDHCDSINVSAGKNAVFTDILLNANETAFVKSTPNAVGIDCVFNGFIQA